MIALGLHDSGQKAPLTASKSDLLYHTAVIGQSGSGKSYFIARLLEELALRTLARIVVIDPNGDFDHFYAPREETFWSSNGFANTLQKMTSFTPSFDTRNTFYDAWQKRRFQFLVAGHEGVNELRAGANLSSLFLHWKWIEAEQGFLLNVDPLLYPKMAQGIATCNHYVRDNKALYPQSASLADLEDIADQFALKRLPLGSYPEAQTLAEEDWLGVRLQYRELRKRFHRLWHQGQLKDQKKAPADLSGYLLRGFRKSNPWQVCDVGLAGLDLDHMLLAALVTLRSLWQSSLFAWRLARQKHAAETQKSLEKSLGLSATVVGSKDPEVTDADAELIEKIEDQQWSDNRVPTFIVIDEAHNFAPQEPVNRLQARVSDLIATIAAEGRKYGLFVLLATQRPQKLRKGLLSECENACLLRIQSKIERSHAAEALGIPAETVDQVSTFETGIALLHGRWVPSPQRIKFAPARTVLGGGGIDPNYWKSSP